MNFWLIVTSVWKQAGMFGTRRLVGFESDELEALALMLIGARTQLTRSVAAAGAVSPEHLEAICAIYGKLVEGGAGDGGGKAAA